MYCWALLDSENVCKNAVLTPNEGVKPKPEAYDDRVIEIPESYFNFELVGKIYVDGQFEVLENKKMTLISPGPYVIGLINLQFRQQTIAGVDVVEPTTFEVGINGQWQSVYVDDGILEIELDCSEPATVNISIAGYRHQLCQVQLIVEEGE